MAQPLPALSIVKRLGQSGPLLCSWLMMPGAYQAGVYAAGALEAVLLDMQHGMIGYRDMVAMVQQVVNQGGYCVVRPPLGDFAMVSRALDVGAAGVVFPMINSPEDARRLVEAAKFPPLGGRSWGAYLGQSGLGLDKAQYLQQANGLNAVFAMIETRQALENVDAICAVDGIDGVFVGPNDLCISLTNGKAADIDHKSVQGALPAILAAARNHGKFAGLYTSTREQLQTYTRMGFQFMPALTDVAMVSQAVARAGNAGTEDR